MIKIEDPGYTAMDFLYRLHLIQKTLQKDNIDALLVINGTDGLNNKESAMMMNWLFKGNSGSPILSDFYLDPLFEESFMVVRQKGCSLFGSDRLFTTYFQYLTAVPFRDLKIYSETEAEKNKDDFEMAKIKEFYRQVENCRTIGMFIDEADPKVFKRRVENIPLVQSYALDGKFIRYRRRVFYIKERNPAYSTEC